MQETRATRREAVGTAPVASSCLDDPRPLFRCATASLLGVYLTPEWGGSQLLPAVVLQQKRGPVSDHHQPQTHESRGTVPRLSPKGGEEEKPPLTLPILYHISPDGT